MAHARGLGRAITSHGRSKYEEDVVGVDHRSHRCSNADHRVWPRRGTLGVRLARRRLGLARRKGLAGRLGLGRRSTRLCACQVPTMDTATATRPIATAITVTFPFIVIVMIHTSAVTAIIIEPLHGRVFRCIEIDVGAKRRQSRSATHR